MLYSNAIKCAEEGLNLPAKALQAIIHGGTLFCANISTHSRVASKRVAEYRCGSLTSKCR